MPVCDQGRGVVVSCGKGILLAGRTGEEGGKPFRGGVKVRKTIGMGAGREGKGREGILAGGNCRRNLVGGRRG